MNAARPASTIPPAAFQELCDFLRMSGSSYSSTDAVISAIRLWIATERAGHTPSQGYQWKQLFLPAGTRLRMQFDGRWWYAEVVGDHLMYGNQALSPRQLTLAIAGDGRNAWRDLWLRRPGETDWHQAGRLRLALRDTAPAAPPSPFVAMQAAARSMSQALQTALALVDHILDEVQHATERRLPKHRRRDDYLLDECRAD
ncbi:MAG: hypothetical protein ACEQSK_02905 [Sphingomonadaceae bacterium]